MPQLTVGKDQIRKKLFKIADKVAIRKEKLYNAKSRQERLDLQDEINYLEDIKAEYEDQLHS